MHSFTCFHVENKRTSRNHLCAATLAKRGEQTREANCVKPGERAKGWCATRLQGEEKGERREGENGDQQAITQPGEAKQLSACLAPTSRRISQSCAGAYAAKVLVLRFRFRWIIHPGVLISPLM